MYLVPELRLLPMDGCGGGEQRCLQMIPAFTGLEVPSSGRYTFRQVSTSGVAPTHSTHHAPAPGLRECVREKTT